MYYPSDHERTEELSLGHGRIDRLCTECGIVFPHVTETILDKQGGKQKMNSFVALGVTSSGSVVGHKLLMHISSIPFFALVLYIRMRKIAVATRSNAS